MIFADQHEGLYGKISSCMIRFLYSILKQKLVVVDSVACTGRQSGTTHRDDSEPFTGHSRCG